MDRFIMTMNAFWLLFLECLKIQIGIIISIWIYYRVKAVFAFFKNRRK